MPAPQSAVPATPVPATPAIAPDVLAAAGVGKAAPAEIGDELAEIQFYLVQGLEADARSVYEELERRFPDHPDVALLRPRFDSGVALVAGDEGAAPVAILSDEDAEADNYLDDIFSADPAGSAARRGSPDRCRRTSDPGWSRAGQPSTPR